MFFQPELLTQTSGFALPWYAGTVGLDKDIAPLTRRVYGTANIPSLCRDLLRLQIPLAVRIRATLLLGICRLYAHKATLLLGDATMLQTHAARLSRPVKQAKQSRRGKSITIVSNPQLEFSSFGSIEGLLADLPPEMDMSSEYSSLSPPPSTSPASPTPDISEFSGFDEMLSDLDVSLSVKSFPLDASIAAANDPDSISDIEGIFGHLSSTPPPAASLSKYQERNTHKSGPKFDIPRARPASALSEHSDGSDIPETTKKTRKWKPAYDHILELPLQLDTERLQQYLAHMRSEHFRKRQRSVPAGRTSTVIWQRQDSDILASALCHATTATMPEEKLLAQPHTSDFHMADFDYDESVEGARDQSPFGTIEHGRRAGYETDYDTISDILPWNLSAASMEFTGVSPISMNSLPYASLSRASVSSSARATPHLPSPITPTPPTTLPPSQARGSAGRVARLHEDPGWQLEPRQIHVVHEEPVSEATRIEPTPRQHDPLQTEEQNFLRYVHQRRGARQATYFHELLDPATSGRYMMAKAFALLLELADKSWIRVEQQESYNPIAVTMT